MDKARITLWAASSLLVALFVLSLTSNGTLLSGLPVATWMAVALALVAVAAWAALVVHSSQPGVGDRREP